MDTQETIKQQLSDNNVILYMKGSPTAPQCGFSQRTSQLLMACGQRFAYVDVLANPEIAKLPGWVIALVVAGGLAAALSTAAGLLLAISSAVSSE